MSQTDFIEDANPVRDIENEHHYYACFACGWATADTAAHAIEKLVNRFRRDFTPIVKNQQKEGSPGGYIWTCRVHAPEGASYPIEFYQPKNVETDEHQEYYVTYLTQKKMAYWRKT